MTPLEAVAIVVAVSFLPPLLFAWWLRNAERRLREPWPRVWRAFAWGAISAVVFAIIGEAIILSRLAGDSEFVLSLGAWTFALPVLAVVVAPVVEEVSKGLGLLGFRDAAPEPENGYIYGGAIGLGFAATENLVYVAGAWLLQGPEVAAVTAAYRGIATVSLHGAASALVGYGVWRYRFGRGGAAIAVASLLVAILVHAAYNAMASVPAAIALPLLFALVMFGWVVRRVRRLDRRSA